MNTLFSLIKTLNKSEKRRFKLNSSKKSGQNKYLILFKFMEQMSSENEEYNEARLVSSLEEVSFFKKGTNQKSKLNYLRVMQGYLKEQILKTLRGLHETEEKPGYLINLNLLNSELTSRKNLNELSNKEIRKAIALAQKFELTSDLFHIKRHQVGIAHYNFDKDTTNKVNDYHEELFRLLEQMAIETRYSQLFNKLYCLYKEGIRYSKNKKELKLLDKEVNALDLKIATNNFHTHYIYYTINGFFYLITNNLKKALKNINEAIKLWEERKVFIKEYPMRYQMLLANCLNISIISNNYDNYASLLKKMKKLKVERLKDQIYNETIILQIEQFRILNTYSFYESMDFVKTLERFLIKYNNKIADAKRFLFKYNTMVLYFMMEDYKKALEASKKLLAFKNKKVRKDLRAKTILFHLIFLYERNNKKELENTLLEEDNDEYWNAISGAKGKITRQKQHNDFHKLIQRSLLNITFISDPQGIKRAFYVMRSKLFELREIVGNENIGGLGIQEAIYWIESKVTGKSIRNIIEEDKNSDKH